MAEDKFIFLKQKSLNLKPQYALRLYAVISGECVYFNLTFNGLCINLIVE
jgi:hypothetical protein